MKKTVEVGVYKGSTVRFLVGTLLVNLESRDVLEYSLYAFGWVNGPLADLIWSIAITYVLPMFGWEIRGFEGFVVTEGEVGSEMCDVVIIYG